MIIHQLSVQHDERQDRLLLRLNTRDQQEFRFWLTRRMTLLLMPAIQQSAERLEAATPGVAATDIPAQQLLSELKREAFLQKADLTTPYDTHATQWPLGAEPLLITDVHLSIQAHDTLDMSFEDKSDPTQARSCTLNLQVSLVHGMLHLIHQASEKAKWLASSSPHKATEPDVGPVSPPHRYAH